MTAPAARPARMSSRKSPTTSVSSGGDAHGRGRVQHAVRRGLGRDVAVVAGHDDVEVGQRERGEAAQGALDGAAPVAREHADGEAGLA